jgi:predicted permease
MIEQFYDVHSIVLGISKILLLIAVGYVLRLTTLLKSEGIDGLSKVLLWVCLPSLILTKVTSTFNPAAFPGWWFLPLCSIAISLGGLAIGYVFQKPFPRFTSDREFMSACAFQNSGYLPMTLVAFVCSGAFCDRILIYIFLFLIGFNLTIWSFVPAFLSRSFKRNFKLSSLLNPPLVATIFAIISVFVAGSEWIPHLFYDPLYMLGEACFPLALITLGAYLAESRGYIAKSGIVLASCLAAKLVILPLVVFIIVKLGTLTISYKFFIFVEATMPSAVSLAIIGYEKKADNQFLTGMIFYSHLFAIVTVPIWLYIFSIVI